MTNRTKYIIGILSAILLVSLAFILPSYIISNTDNGYSLGTVSYVTEQATTEGQETLFEYGVEVVKGPNAGEIVITSQPQVYAADNGATVVVHSYENSEGIQYVITEPFRIGAILLLFVIFCFAIVLFAQKSGLRSIIGLILSFVILTTFIAPQIAAGANPVLIGIIGSMGIVIFSMLFSHGFNKKVYVAVSGTVITLVIAVIFAEIAIRITGLSGMGTEEAYFLQFSNLDISDYKGLLLAGIIIGVLGVLDDITTAQSAAVYELHDANNRLTLKELYSRGASIGREHIVSLVNTLFLAYAGASFPLFLYLTINRNIPMWVLVNSEFIVEEIVRALSGSVALILAVPITTLLASAYVKKTEKR